MDAFPKGDPVVCPGVEEVLPNRVPAGFCALFPKMPPELGVSVGLGVCDDPAPNKEFVWPVVAADLFCVPKLNADVPLLFAPLLAALPKSEGPDPGVEVVPKGEVVEPPVVAPTFPNRPPELDPVLALPAEPNKPPPEAPLEAGGSNENMIVTNLGRG